jgi:hypothetical protein
MPTPQLNMTVQLNENELRATDPPGSREGFEDQAHPPRQCLQATSLNNEISRSRGDWGPSPGYSQRDPPCGSSTQVALAAAATGKRQLTSDTCTHSTQRARVGEATGLPGTSTRGSVTPPQSQAPDNRMGYQEEVRRQVNGTAAGSTAPERRADRQTTSEGAHARHHRPLRGCPQNEEHAPAFFTQKRDKQQINNPRMSRNTRANLKLMQST